MNTKIKNVYRYAVTLLALIFILAAGVAWAADKYPARQNTAVNDFAGLIDQANKAKIEALAREVLEKTGTAIVVATITTIGDNAEFEMYANGLYAFWGIGKKGEDKGVLILLAGKERRIRIETGYGVEGILPDGLVGEILDKYVIPQLKEGNYSQGLYNAAYVTAAIIAKDAGVQLSGAPSLYRSKGRTEQKGVSIFGIIIFLVVAALLLGTRTGRSMLPFILMMLLSGSGRGGSGGFGGGFGGFGGGSSGGGGSSRSF